MPAYYNEIDPQKAAWLRELIREKVIADGEVDERSIAEKIEAKEAEVGVRGVWSGGLKGFGVKYRPIPSV